MKRTTCKTLEQNSIFLKLFEEPTIVNNTAGYPRFMNDNFNAKRVDDAFVWAEVEILSSYENKQKAIDEKCSKYISEGDNVLSVAGQFVGGSDYSFKERLNLVEQLKLLLRPAIHNLAKLGTTRIYDENNFHGVYYFLVHPDIKEKIDNDKQLIMIFKNYGIETIELDFLPTSKNSKEETVYNSILLGDYAFGVTYDEKKNICSYKRINEKHMIRIETVA